MAIWTNYFPAFHTLTENIFSKFHLSINMKKSIIEYISKPNLQIDKYIYTIILNE